MPLHSLAVSLQYLHKTWFFQSYCNDFTLSCNVFAIPLESLVFKKSLQCLYIILLCFCNSFTNLWLCRVTKIPLHSLAMSLPYLYKTWSLQSHYNDFILSCNVLAIPLQNLIILLSERHLTQMHLLLNTKSILVGGTIIILIRLQNDAYQKQRKRDLKQVKIYALI